MRDGWNVLILRANKNEESRVTLHPFLAIDVELTALPDMLDG
jgi:hypothetical protein